MDGDSGYTAIVLLFFIVAYFKAVIDKDNLRAKFDEERAEHYRIIYDLRNRLEENLAEEEEEDIFLFPIKPTEAELRKYFAMDNKDPA